MSVSQLPAVKEATSSGGVVAHIIGKLWAHPNIGLAKQVLKDGHVPVEEVTFLRLVRELTPTEYATLGSFNYKGSQVTRFERVFVVPQYSIDVLTFGPYLVMDEHTFHSRYIEMVLAHELAHLNNGDSYVKAALYFLGKGWFAEYMTPYALRTKTEQEVAEELTRKVATGTRIALNAVEHGWKSGLLGAGIAIGADMIAGSGSAVTKNEKRITNFLHKWDLEADAKAEKWIGADYYYEYLRALPDSHAPFEASPNTRRDVAEARANPPHALLPAARHVPSKPTNWGLIIGLVIIVAVGLFMFMGFVFVVGMVFLGALS